MKLELEELIAGNSISKAIDNSIVMSEVEDSNENIWSFLLMWGLANISLNHTNRNLK